MTQTCCLWNMTSADEKQPLEKFYVSELSYCIEARVGNPESLMKSVSNIAGRLSTTIIHSVSFYYSILFIF